MNLMGFHALKVKLKKWSDKPFPFPDGWLRPVLIAAFVFFLLLLLEPCGIENISEGKVPFISGFSLVTLLILFFSNKGLPQIFPIAFDPDKWTSGKYLYYVLWEYSATTVFLWIYNETIGRKFIPHIDLFHFFIITFLIGIGPTVVTFFAVERIVLKRNLVISERLTKQLNEMQKMVGPSDELNLTGSESDLPVIINSDDFICAQSNGNYTLIWISDKGHVSKYLLRITLFELEKQLFGKNNFIIRCHRKSIINLKFVTKISSNARNYYLHLLDPTLQISVSRTSSRQVLALIDNLGKNRVP